MRKEYSILLRTAIPLIVAVGGYYVLSSMPAQKSSYNPEVLQAESYRLVDADRDGDVDLIEPKDRGKLVASDMIDWIRDNVPNQHFISQCQRITPELQQSANRTLKGLQRESVLEEELMKRF